MDQISLSSPRPGERVSAVVCGSAPKPYAAAPASASAIRNLIDERFDHDSCGVGFVATIAGAATDNSILQQALTALARLAHRGAVAADGKSSDGVGVMTAIPRSLLLHSAGLSLRADEMLGVGVLFTHEGDRRAESLLESCVTDEGFRVLAWREVPIRRERLGEIALSTLPAIHQLLLSDTRADAEANRERRLYLARKRFERAGAETGLKAYVATLSCRTIVYKAMCTGSLLAEFFPDLERADYITPFALFHQRYATNTLPAWHRAQPGRLLAHNGEINTVWGNRARMAARDSSFPEEVKPILSEGGTDSTSLDETIELIARNGRSLPEALRMLLPPAVMGRNSSFLKYHMDVAEPWDGPAALAFSDGRIVGAALDRNGLRPSRFAVTRSGLVVAGSEVGLVDLDPNEVSHSGRLGPGEMLVVDLEAGRLYENEELWHIFDSDSTYVRLIEDAPLTAVSDVPHPDAAALAYAQRCFGYTREDVKMILQPMATDGKDAVWSMGDDTPLAFFARSPRPVYAYFRQRFAQVTNPAIDPLREACVVSMHTRLGPWPHLLDKRSPLPGLSLVSPFLSLGQVEALRSGLHPHADELKVVELACTLSATSTLASGLDALCAAAASRPFATARACFCCPIARPTPSPFPSPWPWRPEPCTRPWSPPVCAPAPALPSRQPTAATRTTPPYSSVTAPASSARGLRSKPRAALPNPATILPRPSNACSRPSTPASPRSCPRWASRWSTAIAERTSSTASASTRASSTAASPARPRRSPASASLSSRCRSVPSGSAEAVGDALGELPDYGWVRFRKADNAEPHAVAAAHRQGAAVRRRQRSRRPAHGGPQVRLCHLLAQPQRRVNRPCCATCSRSGPPALNSLLTDVEPTASLTRRFVSSAMSLGSLSPEAHQTITAAMNLLGGRSNTGEGGEDRDVYRKPAATSAPSLPSANSMQAQQGGGTLVAEPATAVANGGVSLNNKIKQIASGRFGVTAEYLAHAEEIEIKVAQGAKPGEGGQLPGFKVSGMIARLRHAQPGVSLISPPPHHDIYSIEDLAQLIYDLKRVNPKAAVGVKLVSAVASAPSPPVSPRPTPTSSSSPATPAAPVPRRCPASSTPAVPGSSASPRPSKSYSPTACAAASACAPTAASATARDVLVAALLGADEFAFGTAVLVAIGCDMARQCHLNTCPTGIATQKPELRAKFRGKPEHVVLFFEQLAGELQQLLARYGLQSIEEAIGRTDLLEQVRFDGSLDLQPMLARPNDGPRKWQGQTNQQPMATPLDEPWVEPASPPSSKGSHTSSTPPSPTATAPSVPASPARSPSAAPRPTSPSTSRSTSTAPPASPSAPSPSKACS